MAKKFLNVIIVTQERRLYESEHASMVLLPGYEGQLGILPSHAPMLTMLRDGILTVCRPDREDHLVGIFGGFAEVTPDQVLVLADAAHRDDEVTLSEAQGARERARERLKEEPLLSPEEAAQLREMLRRAEIDVKLAMGYRTRHTPVSIRTTDE